MPFAASLRWPARRCCCAATGARARLLLWAGVCFTLLALNNALVFVDMVTMPEIDLSFWRTLPALAGVGALIYGLVWEEHRDV